MNDFWANIEAQQKLIESNPNLMMLSIVLQVVFIIVGFILARKILKESKLSGRNGMLWAVVTFLTWLLLGILGFIPVAIFYMTNKKAVTQPQMRNLSGEMIKCPSCNYAKNPPDAVICGLCGRPLPIIEASVQQSDGQTKVCSSCGDANPATNKFCRNCGKEL